MGSHLSGNDTKLDRCEVSAMPRNYGFCCVNAERTVETEGLDAPGNLCHLGIRMPVGVSGVRLKLLERPKLDALRHYLRKIPRLVWLRNPPQGAPVAPARRTESSTKIIAALKQLVHCP